jgi:2-methylcitrate dehydratase PrpD
MAPTASEVLASFAARLQRKEIPNPVVDFAAQHVLDLLGVALAASSMTFARRALAACDDLAGRGDAVVIGRPTGLPPAWAALANGTLAHGIDFDDTHTESVVHVSTSVVPAALAAAHSRAVDGAGFLSAIVLGMESNIRLGLVARGAFHDRGFHPTGICGTFAAALVAAKLAGLEAEAMADALGLSNSMAAGSMEFLSDGSWAKRIHGGWAAHAGIVACQLARHGFHGPSGALDGRFGLYRTHLDDSAWNIAALDDALGERWELLETGLKPFPCCHFTHAFIDCAAALAKVADLRPVDIEKIDCYVAERVMPIVCEPVAAKRAPRTEYDAKFSLPYAVACMLVRGHVDVDDFDDEAIRDPAILRLTEITECHVDPSADYPRTFPGRLRITLTDGRQLEHHEPINRGSAGRPLSETEVREKFHRNATRVLPAAQAEQLADEVLSLDQAPSIDKLATLLIPPTR